MSRKLRVGVLLNSHTVTAWHKRMLERIQESRYAEISLLIVDASPQADALPETPRNASLARSLRRLLTRPLIAFRSRLDRTGHLPDPFEPCAIDDIVASAETIDVIPERKGAIDRINAADLERIRAHGPDIIVRLGFRILRGEILSVARYGTWSFHHGDNRVKRGLPPGFWEVYEKETNIGCVLQVLSERLDGGLILARTWSSVHLDSVARTNIGSYWKSLSLLPRELEKLHRLGADQYFSEARAANSHPEFYSKPLYRNPSLAVQARVWASTTARSALVRAQERFSGEQWGVMLSERPEQADSLWRYKRIMPPRDRIWADPFVITRDGRTCIFIEEMAHARQIGHIAVLEADSEGTYRSSSVIDTGSHLSFPFLLERDGVLYMIPESRATNCIPLYRCVNFPHQWERLPDLMSNVIAVDSVVHYREGRWWLFTNIVENPGASSNDELFAFYADSFPTTQWTPHAANPIVSDVRSARAAGAIFQGGDGAWYRPSQDCSAKYGWRININRIDRLEPEHYQETRLSRVTPDWATEVIAVHTYNRYGSMQVFDASFTRWLPY